MANKHIKAKQGEHREREREYPLTLTDLVGFQDTVISQFNQWWATAEENERIKRAIHFTDEQIAKIEAQNRQPYSIAMTASKLNHVLEAQRRNRTEFKLEASQDPNDELKAEIGNVQVRDFEKRNKFKYHESEVFDAGASVLVGISEICVEKDRQGYNVVNVKNVDYRDFIWDINAREYEKSDALFMAKLHKVLRWQLEEEYPDIDVAISDGQTTDWGREKKEFYVTKSRSENNAFDIITKITHYQKVLREYHTVLFNDYANLNGKQEQSKILVTRSKKEAERMLRMMKLPYMIKGLPLGKAEITSRDEVRIDKYVHTYDRILEYEETELEDFPFSIYQSYHFQDNIWTLVDVLKSLQRFYDRYFMQIDYSLGKDIKNVVEIVRSALSEGQVPEQVIKQLNEDGIIFTERPGAVSVLNTNSVNPLWVNMLTMAQTILEDFTGGRSLQGLQEKGGESGVAIQRKQIEGEKIASYLIGNHSRYKQDLATKLIWHFKNYDTSERVIKVGGGALSPEMIQILQQEGIYTPSQSDKGMGYITINKEGMSHLQDAEFEITVTESPQSETQRERRQLQLFMIGKQNPLMQQVPEYNDLLLQTGDLGYQDRIRLIEGYKNLLQAQSEEAQKQAEREADFKQQELNIKKADLLQKADSEEKDRVMKATETKSKGKE